jgi:tetratricopeptide (TPR) repeat protein
MLHYAGWLSQAGDSEGAARLLDEVLLLDAQNATALEMLRALGYALPEVEHYEAAPEIQPPSTATDLFAPPSFAVPSAYDYHQQLQAQQYGHAQQQPTYPNDATDIGTAPPPASYAPEQTRGSYVDDPNADPYGGLQPYSESGYTDEYGNYVDTSGQALGQGVGDYPADGVVDPSSYDPDAPLPSYDLEEVGAEQALSRHYTGSHPAIGSIPSALSHAPLVELDDPFGPLPSFPIDDGSVQVVDAPPLSSPSPMAGAAAARGAIDEDALEEIDFFTQHGMIEEAKNLLVEQLARAPNHPLLLERQRELMQASSRAPSAAPPPSSHLDDRSFDIAASLGALDELDAPAPQAVKKPASPAFGEQVSVETVFEQFKAGVAAQVSESDAATHYELGLAYKDMGLVQDAIREFEIAARDPARTCVAESLVGMMHLDHGQIDPAIDAFIRGLHAAEKTPEQELALTYEVGNAYELRGNADQAIYYFQLVARNDPGYRDGRGSVAERIARLQPQGRAAAVATSGNDGLGDDFDQAFDDLFGKN